LLGIEVLEAKRCRELKHFLQNALKLNDFLA